MDESNNTRKRSQRKCWWIFFHDWVDTEHWSYDWKGQECKKCGRGRRVYRS